MGDGTDLLFSAWQMGLPVPSFEPQARPSLSLHGTWRKERFRADHNLSLSTRGGEGLAALEAEAAGRHRADFDDSRWESLELPAVENQMPRLWGDPDGPEPYEDGVWYRRTFAVPADWQGSLVTVNFLAVNYVADVWVNGTWVGYHEGGHSPFALDLTAALKYGGQNVIAVRVDNPPWGTRLETVPGPAPDWWNYTGIIHDLYLEAAPLFRVVRVDVRPLDRTGLVRVTALVHNAGAKPAQGALTLRFRHTDSSLPAWLTDPGPAAIAGQPAGEPFQIALSAGAGEAVFVRVTMQVPDPHLWAPTTPYLYVAEADLSVGGRLTDQFATQFGIRTLGTENAKLLLNGEPIFLTGLARHEEWPDTGRTATWERIRADLEQVRAMGANFLRTAHYHNHPHTYTLADRIGLATWVEVPVWQFTEVEFRIQEKRMIADQMWREMILAEANRPSVWFWSTQNESVAGRLRVEYNSRLVADWQKHFDDGRLLTQSAAADRGGPGDPSMASLDVPGWTLYFGIFHGSTYYEGTRSFLEQAHRVWPDRPILDTEFGIWSRGGGSSEERQAEVFRETWRAFAERVSVEPDGTVVPDGFVAGVTWWTIFDWYTAHTKLQTMGLYHMDRTREKQVAELVRDVYRPWSRR